MGLDLELISGDFLSGTVGEDKCYFKHFFRTDLQVAFLNYYTVFSSLKIRDFNNKYIKTRSTTFLRTCFTDHTGMHCKTRIFFRMMARYLEIEELVKVATETHDFQTLQRLHSGDYSIIFSHHDRLNVLKKKLEENG